MKRGLVIGKFLPVHTGHIALINFASSHCDEVIVSMSYKNDDPINPQLRLAWLKQIFESNTSIRVEISADDFDDESLPLKQRMKLWATFIRKRFPPIDALFSSEEYGDPFAANLNIKHVVFDQDRVQLPVSATLIRNNPFQYWNFIPPVVRPYFVKKICFYGPESTGKSYMSQRMAELYDTEFVPEVARELITSNEFSIEDIIRIGHAQAQRIHDKSITANKVLFCDTDVITTQVYSRHYLNVIPPVLYELEKQVHYDQYFLFSADVPWVADGLRDLGDKRKEMHGVFRQELENRNINYISVHGSWVQREEIVRIEIDRILSSS